MTQDIAAMIELSEKATQGSYTPENPHKINPSTTVCYLHFGERLPWDAGWYYKDCLSVASERGLADANFIAALVNWFRANAIRLAEFEKDAERYRWWVSKYFGSYDELDEINALRADGPEDWGRAIDAAKESGK